MTQVTRVCTSSCAAVIQMRLTFTNWSYSWPLSISTTGARSTHSRLQLKTFITAVYSQATRCIAKLGNLSILRIFKSGTGDYWRWTKAIINSDQEYYQVCVLSQVGSLSLHVPSFWHSLVGDPLSWWLVLHMYVATEPGRIWPVLSTLSTITWPPTGLSIAGQDTTLEAAEEFNLLIIVAQI